MKPETQSVVVIDEAKLESDEMNAKHAHEATANTTVVEPVSESHVTKDDTPAPVLYWERVSLCSGLFVYL